MTIKEQYQILKTDSNLTHFISENDCESVFNFLKKNKHFERTLQIGLGYGTLALAVLVAINKLHIVIDPYQSRFQFLGIKNLKNLGLFELVDYRDDYSFAVLPKLFEGSVLPNFIILDNDQTFDKMINDFVNIDLIMKKGSFLLIRKSGNPNNILLHKYIATNRPDFIPTDIALTDFVLFQKIARDIRENNFLGIF